MHLCCLLLRLFVIYFNSENDVWQHEKANTDSFSLFLLLETIPNEQRSERAWNQFTDKAPIETKQLHNKSLNS